MNITASLYRICPRTYDAQVGWVGDFVAVVVGGGGGGCLLFLCCLFLLLLGFGEVCLFVVVVLGMEWGGGGGWRLTKPFSLIFSAILAVSAKHRFCHN